MAVRRRAVGRARSIRPSRPKRRVTVQAASAAAAASAASKARSGTTTTGSSLARQPTGLPCVVLLHTRAHFDFLDLPDELARELGPLLIRVQRAVYAIGDIGNVHVCRWGDGSEHSTCGSWPGPRGWRS